MKRWIILKKNKQNKFFKNTSLLYQKCLKIFKQDLCIEIKDCLTNNHSLIKKKNGIYYLYLKL